MGTYLKDTDKIKKAQNELKRISNMRKELQRYGTSSIKSTLLKSCELCETIWALELDALKGKGRKVKSKSATEKQFENMGIAELEEIAFSIYTPDHIAQMALAELINRA